MTASLSNVTLDAGQWVDLCGVYPVIARRDVVVRYAASLSARIFHGGGAAPAGLTDGDPLNPGEAVYANSDHIWVTGIGTVSVTQL